MKKSKEDKRYRNLLRMAKSSGIDMSKNTLTMEEFENFLVNHYDSHIASSEKRIDFLARSLRLSTQEIDDYKEKLKASEVANIHSSKLAAVGDMAANISHEINNPMTTISMYSQLVEMELETLLDHLVKKDGVLKIEDEATLLEDIVDFSEQTKSNLDTINKTVKRVQDIILSLKRISNGSSDLEEMEIEQECLISAINESCLFSFEQLKNLRIKFNFLYDKEEDYTAHIPKVEFSNVLINLLTNAKQEVEKYDDPKERFINIELSQDDDFFYVIMENGGKPIPEDISLKIFEPYFSTKDVGVGTGIGLNLSRKIMHLIEGDLTLEQRDKEGSIGVKEHPRFVIKIKKLKGNFIDIDNKKAA